MFQAGDRVKLTARGEALYACQATGTTGTVLGPTGRDSGWFDVEWDNDHSNNYETDDLYIIEDEVVQPVVVEAPKEEGGVGGANPRVKYLYSVVDEAGNAWLNTPDREYAREIKAAMGGKKEGIIIMAYAPLKEIR